MIRRRANFNYQAIGEENRGAASTAAEEIRQLDNGMVTAAVEIGRRLLAVKQIMHDRRQWAAWVRLELRWSVDRAARYIRVATAFGDSPHVGQFTFTALLELAKENTPGPAVAAAVEQAAAGGVIGHRQAAEIIAAHQLPPPPRRAQPANRQGERLERYVQSIAKRWPQHRRCELVALLERLAAELRGDAADPAAGETSPALLAAAS